MRRTALVGLLLTAAACQPTPNSAAAADSAAPAKPDLAAEEQTIRRLDSIWVDAVGRRDTAVVVAMYANDGAMMPPNQPQAQGAEAIRTAWVGMMGTPGFQLTFAPSKIAVGPAGEMAYDIGTYTFGYTGPGGKPGQDNGKYLVVWTKQAGEWKVAADMFNSDLPAR